MRAKMARWGFFGETRGTGRHRKTVQKTQAGLSLTGGELIYPKSQINSTICDGFNSLGKKFNNLSGPRQMSIFRLRDPTIPVQCSQQSSTNYAMCRRTPFIMSVHLSSS